MSCRGLRRAREHFTQMVRIVGEIVSEIVSELVRELVSEIVSELAWKFECPDKGLSGQPGASFAQ